MTEKRRRGGGGKLARTETVQVRLDPKLRFAAELAAAKERRTLSSFIEWAVEGAVRQVHVAWAGNGEPVSAEQVAEETWSEVELERLTALEWAYPELLTIREKELLRTAHALPESPEYWGAHIKALGEFLNSMASPQRAEYCAPEEIQRWREVREALEASLERMRKPLPGMRRRGTHGDFLEFFERLQAEISKPLKPRDATHGT